MSVGVNREFVFTINRAFDFRPTIGALYEFGGAENCARPLPTAMPWAIMSPPHTGLAGGVYQHGFIDPGGVTQNSPWLRRGFFGTIAFAERENHIHVISSEPCDERSTPQRCLLPSPPTHGVAVD